MKVVSIVVNFNDEEDTKKFLEMMNKYEVVDKILVVDNKSTKKDSYENLLLYKSSKIEIIQTDKNGGYNYGINYGIKYLESRKENYDYFIISNPDISIEENAIKKVIDILEKNDNYAMGSPRMYDKNMKPIRRSSWKKRTYLRDVVHSTRFLELIFYKVLRNGEYSSNDYKNSILEVEAISGAFFIVKNKVLKEINYFDENVFLFYEEDILSKKIEEKGYKIFSLNSEKFIHYESKSIGKTFSYFKKMREMLKSRIYFQKKYNHINNIQVAFLYVLYFFRCLELLIEIPIRKILSK